MSFTPVEVECRRLGTPLSEPVRWYTLIGAMEEFRRETGMGLAGIWGLVNRGQLVEAEGRFADLCRAWDEYIAREVAS